MHIWAGLDVATDFVEDDAVAAWAWTWVVNDWLTGCWVNLNVIVRVTVTRDENESMLGIFGKFNL